MRLKSNTFSPKILIGKILFKRKTFFALINPITHKVQQQQQNKAYFLYNPTLLLHQLIFGFLNQKLKKASLRSNSSTKTSFRRTRTTKTAPDHCAFS